jgi:hypothetical protein
MTSENLFIGFGAYSIPVTEKTFLPGFLTNLEATESSSPITHPL